MQGMYSMGNAWRKYHSLKSFHYLLGVAMTQQLNVQLHHLLQLIFKFQVLDFSFVFQIILNI